MNVEVIVVGVGIVGSVCVYELVCCGFDVLVLDSCCGGVIVVGMGYLVVMDDNLVELVFSDYLI